MTEEPIRPVILSGGAGKRLWPLSRQGYPKQFLDGFGTHSLFQQTCRRLCNDFFHNPLVIGNAEHRFIIAEQMRGVGMEAACIVLEPAVRNTAPATLIASLLTAREHENALMLLLPSDHVVERSDVLMRAIRTGMPAARKGAIVLFGMTPDSPHTGYGYIDISRSSGSVYSVRGFTEKPSAEKASGYIKNGTHLWNAGIFLFSAKTMLEAFRIHASEFLEPCRQALDNAYADLDFLRLEETSYEKMPSGSLDQVILEQVSNINCVPVECGWRDLGSWPSVWEMYDKDNHGNATNGDVILQDTSNSLALSSHGCLALSGMDNVIAVATRDAVLVAARDRPGDIYRLVERFAEEQRSEILEHNRIYRPWGWFEKLEHGEGFHIKRIMVKPGGRLSLQSHKHRSEHWIVVSGRLEITASGETCMLGENQSTYIPVGTKHRLANTQEQPAILIEIQTGDYLGEDDIIRFDDVYGRCVKKKYAETKS